MNSGRKDSKELGFVLEVPTNAIANANTNTNTNNKTLFIDTWIVVSQWQSSIFEIFGEGN